MTNPISKCWDAGDLSYALYDYQLPLYRAIKQFISNPTTDIGVICINRQWGKTFTTTTVFMEYCLTNKKQECHFLAEDRVTLKDRVYKAVEVIMEHCPWPERDPRRPV